MRKTFFLSIILTTCAFGGEDDWTLNNSFTLYGDFAYFKREQSHRHKLIFDSSSTDCNCQFPSCSARGLVHDFDFEPGFKVGATYISHHTVWDFFYLWLNPWESHCSKADPGSIFFSVSNPGITTDFDGADEGSVEYHSQFQNCELNFYRYVTTRHGDHFSSAWMLGLRYINLHESLDLSFVNGGDKSSYKVQTMNHIPAFQMGGLIAWNPSSKLSWELLVKVGMGFDAGEQKTFLGDFNNTVVLRDYEKTGFSTPLVTEAALALSYQPLTYLNVHVAYQVIYLNGVALAPDQVIKSSNNDPYYRANGAPLIHGLTAGLGWSF